MKKLFINGHLTSVRDCDKGDCVSCDVADGVVGWTWMMVASMVEPEGAGPGGGGGGYNHEILK